MYKKIALNYLEALKNKGLFTTTGSVNRKFYEQVEAECNKPENTYDECSDNLKYVERSQYLELIKYHHSLHGEVTQRERDDLKSKIGAWHNLGAWLFDDEDLGTLSQLEEQEPESELLVLFKESKAQYNG